MRAKYVDRLYTSFMGWARFHRYDDCARIPSMTLAEFAPGLHLELARRMRNESRDTEIQE